MTAHSHNSSTSKRKYKKIFTIKENADKAIFLLNNGHTYSYIASILKCDHSSVVSFKRRMIKRGVKFINFKKIAKKTSKIKNKRQIRRIITIARNNEEEKINQGKSYEEYVKEDNIKKKKLQEKFLKEVEKRMDKLNKKRKIERFVDTHFPFN